MIAGIHGRGPSRVAKLRKLLEPHASDLVTKAVELALAGDTMALRLCLERLLPHPLYGRSPSSCACRAP